MENKKSKYFKYAIGEIILVVIGILIALQINNWNENRKRETLKKSYIVSLYDNLQEDSIRIASITRFFETDKDDINKMVERIESSNHVLDTMQKIARYEFNLNIDIITSFNDETYKILINTGNIDLLDKILVQRLIKLTKIQELALGINVMNLDFFSQLTVEYGLKYSIKNSSVFSDKTLEPTWEDINEKEFIIHFNTLVSGKQTVGSNILFICEPLSKATELLLEEIRVIYPNLVKKS